MLPIKPSIPIGVVKLVHFPSSIEQSCFLGKTNHNLVVYLRYRSLKKGQKCLLKINSQIVDTALVLIPYVLESFNGKESSLLLLYCL